MTKTFEVPKMQNRHARNAIIFTEDYEEEEEQPKLDKKSASKAHPAPFDTQE